MIKRDKPHQGFLGAILRAYDKAVAAGRDPVRPADLWDYVVMECLHYRDGFKAMFSWDTSTAQNKNRIRDIAECIERGVCPRAGTGPG